MFKNFTPYLIAQAATGPMNWESRSFSPCGETQQVSAGFISSDVIKIERKAVPAETIKRRVNELASVIERETGRKPGKKQRADLADQALQELLPRAFPKQTTVHVMQVGDLMIVGSTGAGDLDVATTLLIHATPGLALGELTTAQHPAAAMTHWVKEGNPPHQFDLGREVTLVMGDRRSTFKGYPLGVSDAVDALLDQDHAVESLALAYDDRVSFTMTDGLQFKGVKLLDVVFEGHESDDEADRALWKGELSRLLASVREALA